VTATDATRRRGRPPQTEADVDAARARIVAATAAVFAEHGSHGMSVARIIEHAGIARPTFYRYFANSDEPLQILLDASDRALVDGLQTALDSADDEIAMVLAGIDAYLAWAQQHGPALRPLFTELHDASSTVSPHRERTLAMLRTRLIARFEQLGRTPPLPADIDVLLNAFEYVGYRVALRGPGEDTTVDWARLTMARLAIGLLGTTADVENALEIPGLLRTPE
jgi:AcrR family transcriptional regulator